jgi:hypothetical protein
VFKFLDPDHPFFQKRWVRWCTVALPAGWTGVEAALGNWGWAAGFGAITAYAFWMLILVGPKGG